MTNGERIRAMSDDDLAIMIMCPYDTAGEPENIMPCIKEFNTNEIVPPKYCHACCTEWLKREVGEDKDVSENV